MRFGYGLVALIMGMVAATAMAGIQIRVVPSISTVAPGQEFSVLIRIDGDTTLAGDQPVPGGGLQSAGVSIRFDPASASISDLLKIIIPAGLDADGLGGPPTRRNNPGDIGYTGFIPLGSPNYTDSLLATILLTNNAASGAYTLQPDLFFPLADPRENFIDGQLSDIDSQITFAPPAMMNVVVPEPASISVCSVMALALMTRRRRHA